MTYLFLDTNIFLHNKFFIEIPWQTLCENKYAIVFAPVVIDELDKHKRHQNSKIASRARQVLTKFEEIVNKPEIFPLAYELRRPLQQTFDDYQLDRKEQDDSILATILEFKAKHAEDRIILVSNDTGPRLRAAPLGIEAVKLDDKYLIPSETSEDQKLIQKLTKENIAYKNKIPKVSLCFKDGATHFAHKLTIFDQTAQQYIGSRLEKLKKRYPFQIWEDPKIANEKFAEALKAQSHTASLSEFLAGNNHINAFGLSSNITEDQVNDYNEDLKEFFMNYRVYLQQEFDFQAIKSLSLPIDLKLINQGNVPAEDIDIWMHFPDGFELFNSGELPESPGEPVAPYLPKHRYDMGHMSAFNMGGIFNSSHNFSPRLNLNEPSIRKTNSYEVDIHYKSLKHFQHHHLDPLIVVFPSYDEIINFTIDYKIVISNVPEPVIGQLSVITQLNGI